MQCTHSDTSPLGTLRRALADLHERLHYVGCGERLLLTPSGRKLNETLYPRVITAPEVWRPDAATPSHKGYYRLLAECWVPAFEGLLGGGG